MELDFDKIKRIRKIRSVKSDLSKEENILIKPILSDKKLIPLIYKNHQRKSDMTRTHNRCHQVLIHSLQVVQAL